MGRIKIIHISDILVGLSQLDINKRISQIQQAAISFDLEKSIDYLVISGNITQDGSLQSFKQAKDFIKKIASILLIRDGREIRLNRVVIVPGKNDIIEPGICDQHYANFKTFYDCLFEKEIINGRAEKFSYERALVRELKDITIIGLCCWQSETDIEIDGIAEKRTLPIYKAVTSQVSSLRYSRNTPTILVTADTPLLAWSTQIYQQRLRQVLKNNLNIMLNLFGSGFASAIYPEPFSFDYISIGTGPKLRGERWPLRMNLIEIEEIKKNFLFSLKEQFDISVIRLHKGEEITPWEQNILDFSYKNNYISENNNFKRWHPDELVYEFLKKIEAKSSGFRPGIILVRGFPGSGKESIFSDSRNFQKIIKIDNQDLFVIVGQLDSYANIDEESTYQINNNEQLRYEQELSRICKTIEEFNSNSQNNLVKKLIVLYDFAFAKTPNSEKRQALLKVRNDLSVFRLADVTIAYITEPLDFTTGFEKSCNAILELSTFPNSLNKLVEQYCYELPIRSEHINCFAGEYFEFSSLLLQESKRRFEQWSGAEPINNETSNKLIRQVIYNSRLIKEQSQIFRTTVETFNGGNELFNYIQTLVSQTIFDSSQLLHEQLNSIYINIAELKRKLNPRTRDAVLDVMRLLMDYGVLEDCFDDDEYKLKLVMPFLISMDSYSVFISFPAKFEAEAEQLKDLLIDIAKLKGKLINPWVFTANIGENNSITKRINKALKMSKNLIIIFESENFTSPYTEGEYSKWERIWRERWRANDARCIPVTLNEFSAEFPYPFGAYDIISASNGLNKEVANQIFTLLVPDDNNLPCQNELHIDNLFNEPK